MKFKKILSLLLAALLIFGMIPVSAAPSGESATEPQTGSNILIGGDFEDKGLAEDNYYATYESPGVLSWHADKGKDGSACVSVPIPQEYNKNACLMYTPGAIALKQGAVYMLSGDVYDPDGALQFVTVDFQEDAWSTWGNSETFTRGAATTGWRTFTAYFQFTETGARTLRVYGPSNGTKSGASLYIDNLKLVEVTDNLLIGGDFEDEAETRANFYPTYDISSMTMNWYADGGVDNSACIGLPISNVAGKNSCLMYGLNSSGVRQMMLVKGELYTLSVDVLLPDGGLQWITTDSETHEWSTHGNELIFKQTSRTDGWQHLEATFRYDGETTLRALRVFGPSQGNAGKEVKIDNWKLTYGDRQNLIRNGDFSDGGNVVSAFFIESGNAYRGGTCEWQATGGADNDGCLRMYGQTDDNPSLMVRDQMTGKDWLQVKSGNVYSVSVDVFRPNGMSGTVALDFETMPSGYSYSAQKATKVGEWETLSYTFTANADGAVFPRIISMNWDNPIRNGEYVLLDNFSMVCLTDANEEPQWKPAGENLVRSGDFASELYSKRDFYATYEANTIKWYPTGGYDNSSCISVVVPASGNACVKYRLDSLVDGVELVKDRWYTVSCDVYIPEGAVSWMSIDFEADAWNCWNTPKVGGNRSCIGTPNSWQHLYMTFKYTDETAMQILRIFGPVLTEGAEVKIDNVSLRCMNDPSILPAFETLPSNLVADSVRITGENTMTVVFTEELADVNTLSLPVYAADANGMMVASAFVSFVKGADGKTFNGVLEPMNESEFRNFSSIWQAAAANNGSMLLDLNQDKVIARTDFAFNPNAFTIEEVKQVGLNTLTVKFSEDIELVDNDRYPYVCLRMVDPTNGNTIINGLWPLQWSAASVAFCDGTKDTLLVTFPESTDIGVLVSKVNMDASFIPYEVMLCMEEGPGSDDFVTGNYLVHQIRRANDGKQLESTFTNYSIGDYDKIYAPVTLLNSLREDVVVEDVEIIDQTRIVVTLSEAVKLNNPEAYIRLVNDQLQLKVTDDGNMMWSGRVEYYNDAKNQIVFILSDRSANHPKIPVDGLNDLFSRNYETGGYSFRLVISDNGIAPIHNGIVDSIVGTTGKPLLADPMNFDIDSVWLKLDGTQVPMGAVTMTKAEIISDTEGILTFSDPIVFEEWCFFAIRFFDKNGGLVWRTPDGKYSTGGHSIEGSLPMQWGCTWEWNNEEHTQIRFKINSGTDIEGMNSFNELITTDWEALIEGGHLVVGFEEFGDVMITDNGRVDNIRLAGDSRVSMAATFTGSDRDSAWIEMDVKYQPREITYSAKIINETQIRITFSEPVNIVSGPYIALRYVDEDGQLKWTEDKYNHWPLQFNGSWENESSTSILWTLNGQTYSNARTLYDIVNFTGGLSEYKDLDIRMCIEELDGEKFKVGQNNGVIDNIVGLDGVNHLKGNKKTGYDGSYVELNTSVLGGERLTVLSAKAIDETHVELKFSRPVSITENAFIGIRYLTPSGDSETFIDGKTANFKGDWEYKDGDQSVIIWTLNSRHADKISDIINYNGDFKWNKGARTAFVIIDDESSQAPQYSMRVRNVTSVDGYLFLEANYATKEFMMAQLDIEIGYDMPAPIVEPEESTMETVYESNYLPFIITSAALVIVGVIVMVLLIAVRKKEEK